MYTHRVNLPTTEACWIEFIGYQMPGKNKIAAQRYSQDINQALPIFQLVIKISKFKVRIAKKLSRRVAQVVAMQKLV